MADLDTPEALERWPEQDRHPKALIRLFRRVSYRGVFFQPGTEVLTGQAFGSLRAEKWKRAGTVDAQGEKDVDTRDLSYAA